MIRDASVRVNVLTSENKDFSVLLFQYQIYDVRYLSFSNNHKALPWTFVIQTSVIKTAIWHRHQVETQVTEFKIIDFISLLGRHRGGCSGNHCPNWHVNLAMWLFSIRKPGKQRYLAIDPCFVEWKIVRPFVIVGGCSWHDLGIQCAWWDNFLSSKHSTVACSTIGW